MKIADKIAARFGYVPQHTRQSVSIKLPQAYKAGELDRLTASFRTTSYTADEHLRLTLRNLRARSRSVAMNDPYAKRFFSLLVTNVIGENGISLQNQAKLIDFGRKDRNGSPVQKFDVPANKAIESAWEDWGTEGSCEVTGEHSFVDVQQIIMRTVARDGEILVRKVHGAEWNKYGFALQLLEADLLDETYWNTLPNGNRIIMGVEKDPWGRRVAYHLLAKHPGELSSGSSFQQSGQGDGIYSANGQYYRRMPAEDIIHIFMSERTGQTRGVPWMYASLLRLNNMNAYEEAAIINARLGASKMGFYESANDDTDIKEFGTGVNAEDGTTTEEIEAGIFQKLPRGYTFKAFDPKYPDSEFKPFNSAMLHGITAGWDVSYSSVTGDLTEVNFSSIRSGKIDERDVYRLLQTWFARRTLGPGKRKVFPCWLDTTLMLGAAKIENGSSLPWRKLDQFNRPEWRGRGFDWVDPEKDLSADILAVNNGFKTRSEICASRGRDFRDICEILSEEQAIAKEYGVEFSQGKTEAAFRKQGKAGEGAKDEGRGTKDEGRLEEK